MISLRGRDSAVLGGLSARRGGLLARLDAYDLDLYRRAAAARTPLLDATLPRLTRSADHAVLWAGVAGLLALSGGRGRRAGVRGLMSLVVASATANVPAKLSARRPRPALHPVPVVRHLSRQPSSTSFPSGHSASAAAFFTGVALEQPVLAVPVGVLAAGVAYGRVHTGVHYPGDVAAGVLLGAGAALAVRRVWPVRPEHPEAGPPAVVPAPALPDGDGLVVVVNAAAGGGGAAPEVERLLAEALPRAQVVQAEGDDVAAALTRAAATARVLGVVGGDGTVNTAAGIALEAGLPLAVVPGGTLDHFAGEVGLGELDDVVRAVREGTAVSVTVGSSAPDGDGGYFLNTFALGVYPELVAERELREGRLGKWPAMLVAVAKVLPDAEPVRVEVEGRPRLLWTLFAGNGHYHPSGFAPSWRERLDGGRVDVRMVDAEHRFSRTRLFLALASGRLGRSKVYEERLVEELSLRAEQPLSIARDGEVEEGVRKLRLRPAADRLLVYRPAEH